MSLLKTMEEGAAFKECIASLEECADWLMDAPKHSDQWERGARAMRALSALKKLRRES